uniref:TOG domain-containing protein n=1 Tax=Strigamia maritima TaxID=126957 RepID=T1J449_STRMM
MAQDQQQFEALLSSLLSSESELRAPAEKTFDTIPLETKVPYLLNTIRNVNAGDEVRQMGAVLLRRLFANDFDDLYPKLTLANQVELKEQLLVAIQQETNSGIRRKICDVTAELARNLIDDDGNNLWPEFLKFLFECANSPVVELKECALQMFSTVPGIFGNQQAHYLDIIKQMLQQSLIDQNNSQVRFMAVKAASSFLLAHERETSIHRHFSDLLPPMIQGIADSIQAQDDDILLKSLIELAENVPRFLRFQIDPIMELCMKVLTDTTMSDNWRHLALEVMVTLAETAPGMVRKSGNKYIGLLVSQVLAMMVDMDDDPEWNSADEITEDDNDSNSVVGESALDRLAVALGGKTILQNFVSNIPPMLSSADWRYRHAALMAISAVGEGCHKQMEALLDQIMEWVLSFLRDPHPRVRYAACNAIGQMSTDFAPTFEKKFHDKVIPSLLMLLGDETQPRVQAHAGAALVNFSEDCPKTILANYLDDIAMKLEGILSSKFQELVRTGNKLVLEQVVTTIASVADTAEEKFINYYDRFMPCLKYIIQNATMPEYRLLRGKTIECVSLIGLAVGREKFMTDASEVMELLLKSQTQQCEMADDDPQVSYMISAWARICKIMGKHFEQYLPLVMDPVMKTASLKPEVTLLDSEDMQSVESDDDWQFVSLGEQVKQTNKLTAESIPYLLECAKLRGQDFLVDMWTYVCPELFKAIDTEPENEVLAEDLHALATSLKFLGAGCLTEAHLEELIRLLDKTLIEHFQRFDDRQEKRKDEDYDEGVEEVLLDEDDEDVYLLSKVSEVVHSLYATYGDRFFVYFDRLLPHFIKMMGNERPWTDHQWALCVFDDVIEYGGPGCIKYQEYFLRNMLNYINDKSADVRQAAVYGLGVLGQFGGDAFARPCAESIPRLMEVINDPESRSSENLNSTENAIAAVTKILKYNSSQVNVNELLPHWLSWLPVWEDEDEVLHVYNYLCDLIEGNHPVVLGKDNSNLPSILRIMASAFEKEAIDQEAEVTKRMVNIVRQIQSNTELFQACLVQLTQEQQAALHAVLSTH